MAVTTPLITKKQKKYEALRIERKDEVVLKKPKGTFFADLVRPIRTLGMDKERMAFIQNLGVLLKAGISLVEAIETITLDMRYRRMRKLCALVLKDINEGIPLWRSLEQHSVVSNYQLSIIRVGEEAGFLAQNIEHLAAQQERDRALRRKVKAALFYPAMVLALSVVIMLSITLFVLPQLIDVLTALNVELPLVTRIIIAISTFGSENGGKVVGGLLIMLVTCYVLYRVRPIRYGVHVLLLFTPFIRTILQDASVARMGLIIGTLLKVGIPPVRALQHVADSLTLLPYKKYFTLLSQQIDVGKSFKKTMAMTPRTDRLIPRPAQQLIVSGEKSGQIADMFIKVADIYTLKTEEQTQMIPIVLEPLLLIFITGVVGIIAYSILVPIYSVVSAF